MMCAQLNGMKLPCFPKAHVASAQNIQASVGECIHDLLSAHLSVICFVSFTVVSLHP